MSRSWSPDSSGRGGGGGGFNEGKGTRGLGAGCREAENERAHGWASLLAQGGEKEGLPQRRQVSQAGLQQAPPTGHCSPMSPSFAELLAQPAGLAAPSSWTRPVGARSSSYITLRAQTSLPPLRPLLKMSPWEKRSIPLDAPVYKSLADGEFCGRGLDSTGFVLNMSGGTRLDV